MKTATRPAKSQSEASGEPEAPPPVAPAPLAPVLSPAEATRAIESGGIVGLFDALLAKDGIAHADMLNTIRPICHTSVVRSAEAMLRQYRDGRGGSDHAAVLAEFDKLVLAGQLLSRAIGHAREWIETHQGELVNDPRHTSGRRRIF